MSQSRHRLIFLGTPEFALPVFHALRALPSCDLVGVITQPDKPSGRGQKLLPPPVKTAGESAGLPVFQPETLKGLKLEGGVVIPPSTASQSLLNLVTFLNSTHPIDAAVVIAYGKIIPQALLNFFPQGAINVHASLLPRWRGAAPIQRALLAGDKESGVCLMKLEAGLDTGPVYTSDAFAISPQETFGTLHDKLAECGARLITAKLPAILSNSLKPHPQPTDGVTYAEKWEREDCRIVWSEPATTTLQRVRACDPVPGAVTSLNGESLKIYRAHLSNLNGATEMPPGTIIRANREEIAVAAPSGECIVLDELLFPGKKRLPVSEILKSRTFNVGDRFE